MKYYLAPLADFTDAPFRLLCQRGGADGTYTEMVSAAALAHSHMPTRRLLELLPEEHSVACQIFGSNVNDIEYATKYITDLGRFTELNLNAGCPMRTVTRAGAGAKLLEEPAKIGRLLEVMVANTTLPVTLKTRLGPNLTHSNILEILSIAEAVGVRGLIVHARYTSQCHGGPVHLDRLTEVVQAAHIPIIGNGSVTDLGTAKAMAATGVAGIMIGRGALAHPTIFSQLKGAPVQELTGSALAAEHLRLILAFHAQLVAHLPEDHLPSEDGFAAIKMHTHLFRYFNGRPGAAKLRARLNSVRTLHEIYSIMKEFDEP